MCGEHHRAQRPRRQLRRFILACAGNSHAGQKWRRKATVHPRVCRELEKTTIKRLQDDGSSPRMRGTRCASPCARSVVRFIPACAGNSSPTTTAVLSCAVHPRVCGELAPKWHSLTNPSGSSPRVRGTPSWRRRSLPARRFIPACAGNSHGDSQPSAARSGSSPRVRGTPGCPWRRSRTHRFIPACAGNSTSSRCAWSGTTVHPRVCGELLRQNHAYVLDSRFIPACAGNSCRSGALPTNATGSSPRVRGTPLGRDLTPSWTRFIPACAGNSACPPSCLRGTPVHPRVCGELSGRGFRQPSAIGSSPRVRGTHRRPRPPTLR